MDTHLLVNTHTQTTVHGYILCDSMHCICNGYTIGASGLPDIHEWLSLRRIHIHLHCTPTHCSGTGERAGGRDTGTVGKDQKSREDKLFSAKQGQLP